MLSFALLRSHYFIMGFILAAAVESIWPGLHIKPRPVFVQYVRKLT